MPGGRPVDLAAAWLCRWEACSQAGRVATLPSKQVLALELDLGGTGDAAEEHYSRTLRSATSGGGRAAEQPG